MAKVRKKLSARHGRLRIGPMPVWFEVPDPRFATWISVKLSLQVQSDAKFQIGEK